MRERIARREAGDAAMATGMDTQAMIPVLAAVYELVSMLFLPWVSVPELKFSPHPHTRPVWELYGISEGLAWKYPVPKSVLDVAGQLSDELRIAVAALSAMTVLFVIAAFWKKRKAARFGQIVFFVNAFLPAAAFLWVMDTNGMVNILLGVPNSFVNLTLNSHVQLTAFAYAQIAAAVFLVPSLPSLLDTRKEYGAEYYMERNVREDRGIGKRTILSFLLILTAIPAVILFGIFFLNDRSEYFIALCIIILSMLPFFLVFEGRRPQAREVVVIAVMAGLAVAGRVAFFMLPQFKPTSAIVIIAGIALGGEAGFLTGALAGFASNFFFGQGPWTPWQMFALGIIGFLAGLIFRRKRGRWRRFRLWMCVYGGLAAFVIYGVLADTGSAFIWLAKLDISSFLGVYAAGVPMNLIHGVSTVFFLAILGEPMLKKLERVKLKYGILEP